MIAKHYILIALLLFLVVAPLVTAQDYVKGQILVGFNESVTEDEANSLIESYDLSWESKFPVLFGIRASYKPEISGQEGWELRNDLANKIVEEDRKLAQEPYTNYLVLNTRVLNDKILIMFNNRATEEEAKVFLEQFEGLEFASYDYAPKWGIVKVPRGQEQEWIETFEKESIVTYAELNHVGTLASTIQNNYIYAIILLGAIILFIVLFIIIKRIRSK